MPKSVTASIMKFFNAGQLSQYMDQGKFSFQYFSQETNFCIGTRRTDTRAGRAWKSGDIHSTHYGKICPIETPEGANIGIINSLALYAAYR